MKKVSAIGFALLMVFAVFVPVVSALNDPTKEGYQSVVNPNPVGEKSPENIGHLDVLLACRSPQIGGEFSIVPVAVSAPFTNGGRVDKGFVDQFVKAFGEPKIEQYLPDGSFDSNYAPGTYLLKQIDGNGGQPEFALVTLKAADAQTVVFLGHGISGITEKAKDIITVTEATYGAQRVVIDQVYVPGVPAVTHEVTHFNGDYDQRTFHGYTYYVYVGCNNGPYEKHGSGHSTHYENVGTHTHTVIDDPAVPAIPEVSHVEGTFVDVKAEVQALLDGGQQTMVFDNRPNPGGIFDAVGGNLMKTIADPAPGQVKSVHIVYTVNGGEPQTIDTMEYEVFTIA